MTIGKWGRIFLFSLILFGVISSMILYYWSDRFPSKTPLRARQVLILNID